MFHLTLRDIDFFSFIHDIYLVDMHHSFPKLEERGKVLSNVDNAFRKQSLWILLSGNSLCEFCFQETVSMNSAFRKQSLWILLSGNSLCEFCFSAEFVDLSSVHDYRVLQTKHLGGRIIVVRIWYRLHRLRLGCLLG